MNTKIWYQASQWGSNFQAKEIMKLKFRALALCPSEWQRANTRNFSFVISSAWKFDPYQLVLYAILVYLRTQFCLSTRFAMAPTLVWLCYLPEVVAWRGKKPSSFVNSSFGRFRLSLAISSFKVGSRLREVVDFLVLCISLHLVPFEHFPVWDRKSVV